MSWVIEYVILVNTYLCPHVISRENVDNWESYQENTKDDVIFYTTFISDDNSLECAHVRRSFQEGEK